MAATLVDRQGRTVGTEHFVRDRAFDQAVPCGEQAGAFLADGAQIFLMDAQAVVELAGFGDQKGSPSQATAFVEHGYFEEYSAEFSIRSFGAEGVLDTDVGFFEAGAEFRDGCRGGRRSCCELRSRGGCGVSRELLPLVEQGLGGIRGSRRWCGGSGFRGGNGRSRRVGGDWLGQDLSDLDDRFGQIEVTKESCGQGADHEGRRVGAVQRASTRSVGGRGRARWVGQGR